MCVCVFVCVTLCLCLSVSVSQCLCLYVIYVIIILSVTYTLLSPLGITDCNRNASQPTEFLMLVDFVQKFAQTFSTATLSSKCACDLIFHLIQSTRHWVHQLENKNTGGKLTEQTRIQTPNLSVLSPGSNHKPLNHIMFSAEC